VPEHSPIPSETAAYDQLESQRRRLDDVAPGHSAIPAEYDTQNPTIHVERLMDNYAKNKIYQCAHNGHNGHWLFTADFRSQNKGSFDTYMRNNAVKVAREHAQRIGHGDIFKGVLYQAKVLTKVNPEACLAGVAEESGEDVVVTPALKH
jgi:hypothetical protein